MTPLHWIGELLRELFGAIPLLLVRGVFVLVPLVLLIWVLRLPRQEVVPPEGKPRWDTNLKLWAALALVIQMVIYLVF